MARINLKAGNEAERKVLAYLEENASEALAGKIAAGSGTLAGCMSYCKTQAQKQAVNNCACVSSEEVFGWAVHYFEDGGRKTEGGKKCVSAEVRECGSAEEDREKCGSALVPDCVSDSEEEETEDGETEDGGQKAEDGETDDGLFGDVNVFGGAE